MAASKQVNNFLSFTYVQKFGCLLFVFQTFVGLFVNNVVLADNCINFGKGRCVCTVKYVTCHDEHWIDNNIVKLYPYIKDNAENITITGSNFTDLSKNVFGSCQGERELVLQQLKYLDFSHNNIHTIHGKTFHCMPHLHTLILAHNEWQLERKGNHSGFFSSIPQLRYLDLTNAFEEMWNGSYHIPKLVDVFSKTNLTQLEHLRLSLNEFMVFGASVADSLCKMPMLKSLNLSDNWIEIPVLRDCMQNLEVLDLSNNSMPIIPGDLRKVLDRLPKLREVRLDLNPFKCDCGMIETHRWLRSTRTEVVDKDALVCDSGYHSSYKGKPILSLAETDLKCQVIPKPSSKAASVVIGILFAIIACTIIAFLYINRNKVQILFGTCKKKTMKFSFLRPHTGYSSVREVTTIENL